MLTESYYHDTRYPVCPYTLPQILEQTCLGNTVNHFTWAETQETLTYLQLYKQGMAVAKGLLAVGLKRGDTVCSFGSSGPDSMLMFIACCSLGIKFMSPYLYAPVKNVMKLAITKGRPSAILVGSITSGDSQEHVCTEFTKVIKDLSTDAQVFYDRKAGDDAQCEVLEGWKSLRDMVELGNKTVTDDVLKSAKSLVAKDELCLYTCSSGSTGEPKVTLLSAATFSNSILSIKIGIGKKVKVYGLPDMTEEELPLIAQLFCCLGNKYDLIIFPSTNSSDDGVVIQGLLSAVEKYRIELMYYSMAYTVQIVNEPAHRAPYDISSLQCIVVAGSVTSWEFKQKMLELAPLSFDSYAGIEFFGCTLSVVGSLLSSRPTSVGQPSPNVEMKVVDENGLTLPVNTRGQLYVRGWPMFLRYEGQPEITAKAMDKDGWYLTGDMVSMDELGYLYVYGRAANAQRWKVEGDVVYSINIESVLRTHPQIRSCMVIGTDSETGHGHDINYVIEPVPGSDLTPKDVKLFAVEQMHSSIEWPMRVFMYTYKQLPKTSGSRPKINRNLLTEEIARKVKSDPSNCLA